MATRERPVSAQGAVYADASTVAIAWRAPGAATVHVAESAHTGGESLTSALAALLAPAGALSTLTIVLGRPLAHTRTIGLPPMSRDLAERILARDWDRYVISASAGAQVVAAREVRRGVWTAAFASADLMQRLAAAARPFAGEIQFITTEDTLATGVARPREAREHAIVVLRDATGPTDVARVARSLPLGGRRLRTGATMDDVAAHARDHGMAGAVVVAHEVRTGRARALATLALDAEPHLPLALPGARARRSEASRVATWWTVAAAAAALLLALPLEQAILGARLRYVSVQRAALAPQVARAMAQRDSLQGRSERLAALADRELRASRTGGIIAAITLALPRDATLSLLQVAGDSVSVEGESRNGGAVYDALRSVHELEQVSLAAPLRRERGITDSAGTIGRFAFTARIKAVRP